MLNNDQNVQECPSALLRINLQEKLKVALASGSKKKTLIVKHKA
jgi:hypothetical protein